MSNIKIYHYHYGDELTLVDGEFKKIIETPCKHFKKRVGSKGCTGDKKNDGCICFVLKNSKEQYVACTPDVIEGPVEYA